MAVKSDMDQYNSKIRDCFDDSYFDVYTNDESTSKALDEYSTAQYYSKTLSLHQTHYSNEDTQDKSYVWENTLIALTSDNDGCLDKGNCNHLLLDGKNTFHDDRQIVLAIAGGDMIPDEQTGTVLDALVRLETYFKHVELGDAMFYAFLFVFCVVFFVKSLVFCFCFLSIHPADDELLMILDGCNSCLNTMGDNKEWVRGYLIFRMKPNLELTLEWQFDDISDCNMRHMQEFEIIFYDNLVNY